MTEEKLRSRMFLKKVVSLNGILKRSSRIKVPVGDENKVNNGDG